MILTKDGIIKIKYDSNIAQPLSVRIKNLQVAVGKLFKKDAIYIPDTNKKKCNIMRFDDNKNVYWLIDKDIVGKEYVAFNTNF